MEIEFLINDKGELYSFKTSDEEAKIEEFKIPSIVNGVKVESIAATFRFSLQKLYGRGVRSIHKLIISDGVEKINAKAFSGMRIEINAVYWPNSCNVIPQFCFSHSKIKSIVGVEEVKEVGTGAFMSTLLKEISWPPKCCCIPTGCFQDCELETIEGIDQVVCIEDLAFRSTKLKYFNWPSKCKKIPSGCFEACHNLSQIHGTEGVTHIGCGAFKRSGIKTFSWPSKCEIISPKCFSGTPLEVIKGVENVTEINVGAFNGTKIKAFSWPENVRATGMASFLDDCDDLEEIIFEGRGIKTVDLENFFSLGNIKKIDLSQLGAVNLLNCSSPKGRELRDKVVFPYYVTEIN